ncbi:Cytochrome P450 monooxygenase aba1 [Cadophora sp. M221]|nr:Cytochrome P450 monooxygenase aba1 [Cadophora sp. M221]
MYSLNNDFNFNWAILCILGLCSLGVVYAGSAVAAWYRLRKFPVPSFSAHFSYLWLAKTTYSGKQYWVHRELNKKHGPLVRIGPNELMTDDPDILKRVSSTRSSYPRDHWYVTGRFNPYHDNMFSVLDPKTHTKFKSRTISAYSGRETPDLEIGVDSQIKTLINLLEQKYAVKAASSPTVMPLLNLGAASCFFTLDVITRLAFGQEFNYLKDETDHYNFLGSIHDLWPQMSTSADIPWIRKVLFSSFFLKLLGPKTTDKKGFGPLMGVAEHHVGKRFAPDAKNQQDMLGSMMKHGLTQKECEVEGLFMVIAGTESTASAIRSVLVHTMTCPRVYQKLKAEIDDAVRMGRVSEPIGIEQAKSLPYLQAVIYEGIRMRPPLLGLLPKVVPAGGDEFHGQYVPANTAICMNMSSLLCSQKLFGADADLFRPERFMELSGDKRKTMERDVELVFGYGQWMCVGKTVAFLELNKAIFEIYRSFDLQLVNPCKPSEVLSYGTFLESNLLVKVAKRYFDPSLTGV